MSPNDFYLTHFGALLLYAGRAAGYEQRNFAPPPALLNATHQAAVIFLVSPETEPGHPDLLLLILPHLCRIVPATREEIRILRGENSNQTRIVLRRPEADMAAEAVRAA